MFRHVIGNNKVSDVNWVEGAEIESDFQNSKFKRIL